MKIKLALSVILSVFVVACNNSSGGSSGGPAVAPVTKESLGQSFESRVAKYDVVSITGNMFTAPESTNDCKFTQTNAEIKYDQSYEAYFLYLSWTGNGCTKTLGTEFAVSKDIPAGITCQTQKDYFSCSGTFEGKAVGYTSEIKDLSPGKIQMTISETSPDGKTSAGTLVLQKR